MKLQRSPESSIELKWSQLESEGEPFENPIQIIAKKTITPLVTHHCYRIPDMAAFKADAADSLVIGLGRDNAREKRARHWSNAHTRPGRACVNIFYSIDEYLYLYLFVTH